jgi:DNA-binding transcriptional LysR family regulator
MRVEFMAVANPSHALHKLGRKVTARDLRRHRRILIRESGPQRKTEVAGVELRWTFSNKASQIRALVEGHGYAWVPVDNVRRELEAGELKVLPMEQGSRSARLMIGFDDPDYPGRDAARLGEIIRERVSKECRIRGTSAT